MGRQIIKQPNGKYCIFSSIVDNVIMCNATEQDIIDFRVKEHTEKIAKEIKEIIADLDKGKKPYHFAKSYTEMLETIEDIHGKEEAENVRKVIEAACRTKD